MDPALGRSYVQIAREGWGQQKSQNCGANPTLSGPADHQLSPLGRRARSAAAALGVNSTDNDLFHNSKVSIDTTLNGLANLCKDNPPATGWPQVFSSDRQQRSNAEAERTNLSAVDFAHKLASIYRETLDLQAKVAYGDLDPQSKASLLFELEAKIDEFQSALKNLLGLDLVAFTTKSESAPTGGPRGAAPMKPRAA